MLNPWFLLGALAVWLGSLVGAYVKGTQEQQVRDTAQAKVQLDAALKTAEDNWATNYQAQLEIEQEKQRNERVRQRKSSQVAKALAADSGARSCGLADAAIGVLRSSIAASNGAEDSPASGGHDGLQPGDPAGGRNPVRTGDGPRANGVDPLGVPAGSQRASGLGN